MANKKTNETTYKNGLYTGVYKGDNGNMLTATQMIYEVNGDEVMVEIENDFKLLYTFLYDQYRSFQSQQKDLFAEWETVFMAIGRSYNTKSKAMVKLLEDCGLLKQIKMPNSNARIKIVADVSLKNIRFVNPSYDAWRAEQKANNAERAAEFAEFNAEKEKAKSEAKQTQNITKSKTEVKDESGNEAKVDTIETSSSSNAQGYRDNQTQVVGIKLKDRQDDLSDPFLDGCGLSHTKPAQSVAPKKPKADTDGNGYGRKCQHCYQNSNGDWDCKDDWCSNCIPF
ncbi:MULTISPECIES: DUF6945 domain-containing protein [Aeromonas]|uniref:Uncharacterized protein n=1 Tax=Aeromonas veronii TaxID=654 RepID=A0A2T4N0P2_AERVE|nr:hypothetical protein [Aeromonas veronii]PTH80420.1 hypothetical protein DAA48_14205 [Aeromonas veronii]QMS74762.1 hypothetical protein M001_011535 [Aeromonas veronii Hm21]RDE59182.1 hypothetical protein DV708_22845 [Aeromonas veronii]